MRTKHAFLAGAATAVVCLTMASLTAYAAPGFNFGGASVQEVVYTFDSVPVSCIDPTLTSDSYMWSIKLTKIDQDFVIDLKNNIYIVAYGGSCNPIGDVVSTIEIPWNGVTVHPKPVGPIFYADFTGAIPDFSLYNAAAELPFFEDISFHLKFNNNVGGKVQGLSGKTGTLQVSGNASLCNILPPVPQQCFILDLNYLDYMGNGQDLACICVTPSVQTIDLTSFLTP